MIRVLLLLLLATPALAAGPERYALVVGANVGGQGTEALYFAEEDAARVGDVLTELGAIPPANLVVLRSPTRGQLTAALARLGDRIAGVGGHATLVFYYSGHAQPDAIQLGRAQTWSYDEVRAAVAATGADVRLLFFDSCFAGGATRTKGAQRAPGFLEEARAEVTASGEVVITSSASDEASQESDEIGGSYFTHYLVSALRGAADSTGDGEVTLEEAYRYVYHRTVAHTAATRAGAQHPGFDYDLRGSGDLVLTRLDARGAALRFDGEPGRYLIFDEDSQRFVAEVQVLPGRPARLMVDAGRYRVQRRGDDALFEQRLTLAPGDEGDVAALTRIPYAEDTTKGAVLRRRRRASGREVAVLGRSSVQAFFDKGVRDTLVPPLPLFGVAVDVRGYAGPLSFRAELLFGSRPHDALLAGSAVAMQFSELLGGVGVYLAPSLPGARAVRPFVGLRAGLLWLHRDFLPPLDQAAQDYVMLAPGLSAGLGLAPDPRLRLSLEARTHLMVYVDDGDQEALGYVEGVLSVGTAF